MRYSYMVGRIKVFEYALNNGEIDSQVASELLGTSLSSASHLLRKLNHEYWLNRYRNKESVGHGYVYYPSRNLIENFDGYVEVARRRIIEEGSQHDE